MPHGITQCYLPPGRGDIPALSGAFLLCGHFMPVVSKLHLQARMYGRVRSVRHRLGEKETVLEKNSAQYPEVVWICREDA